MNTPTNTNGIIAASAEKKTAEKAPAKKQSPANQMKVILDSKSTQKLLQNSLKENAGAFTASVLELYKSDSNLQMCDAGAVFAECLKAVALKLPISKQLGFAYIVPYKGVPQFQIGYKGMIQLCLRTGKYKCINADVVYDGEFRGADKLTGYVDLNGEKISNKIIGYFAYIETTDGFKKAVYWSTEKVREHAKQHSKSYGSGAWQTNFDEMAIKTVMRNLLSKYCLMSTEIENALQAENAPAEEIDYKPLKNENTEIDINVSSTEQKAEIPAETFENTPPESDYPFD